MKKRGCFRSSRRSLLSSTRRRPCRCRFRRRRRRSPPPPSSCCFRCRCRSERKTRPPARSRSRGAGTPGLLHRSGCRLLPRERNTPSRSTRCATLASRGPTATASAAPRAWRPSTAQSRRRSAWRSRRRRCCCCCCFRSKEQEQEQEQERSSSRLFLFSVPGGAGGRGLGPEAAVREARRFESGDVKVDVPGRRRRRSVGPRILGVVLRRIARVARDGVPEAGVADARDVGDDLCGVCLGKKGKKR